LLAVLSCSPIVDHAVASKENMARMKTAYGAAKGQAGSNGAAVAITATAAAAAASKGRKAGARDGHTEVKRVRKS
jgi:hypothetical protein